VAQRGSRQGGDQVLVENRILLPGDA
jgi:hypothetical protein